MAAYRQLDMAGCWLEKLQTELGEAFVSSKTPLSLTTDFAWQARADQRGGNKATACRVG
jgi:hypothetical protein